jgi:hypothetical protein
MCMKCSGMPGCAVCMQLSKRLHCNEWLCVVRVSAGHVSCRALFMLLMLLPYLLLCRDEGGHRGSGSSRHKRSRRSRSRSRSR